MKEKRERRERRTEGRKKRWKKKERKELTRKTMQGPSSVLTLNYSHRETAAAVMSFC